MRPSKTVEEQHPGLQHNVPHCWVCAPRHAHAWLPSTHVPRRRSPHAAPLQNGEACGWRAAPSARIIGRKAER